MRIARTLTSALAAAALLTGCVSVGLGGDVPLNVQYLLSDRSAAPLPRRTATLVGAMLIQPVTADASADTAPITYSRRPGEFATYQFASWTERPVRQVPRLLQQRLEARGLAGAVGLVGDPMTADWLLTVAIESLHHDVAVAPGQSRVALTVELFDRRSRSRVARSQFAADVPSASADAPAAVAAMSSALGRVFDAVVPWVETELQAAAARAPR